MDGHINIEDLFEYGTIEPDKSISDYVENFWFLRNTSDKDVDVTIIPNGRIDLTLFRTTNNEANLFLMGIETKAEKTIIPANMLMFVTSFKLLSAEYILHEITADFVNYEKVIPPDLWNLDDDDLNDFDGYVNKMTIKIQALLPNATDERKCKLFNLIYGFKGNISVKELSEKAYWSTRQINRYFHDQFGIPLKKFCSILRFRASFEHIKKGILFPQQNYFDQSHFIREAKKLSGVSPKELHRNKNDRFVQFSLLDKK